MARRFYGGRRVAIAAPSTPAYWEAETPTGGQEGIQVGNYVIKHYPGAGKIQSYNYHARYGGLSKGVTVNLDQMTTAELGVLRDLFITAIDAEYKRRTAAPAVASIQPDPAEPAKPANNPAAFKALLAGILSKTSAAAV